MGPRAIYILKWLLKKYDLNCIFKTYILFDPWTVQTDKKNLCSNQRPKKHKEVE